MWPKAVRFTAGWIVLGFALTGFAQETGTRRVVNRVVPEYPRVAWDNHLGGTVKVEATVAANGKVKNVSIIGGSPILSIAAANAVRKWRWVPASQDTREPVEVHFEPKH
jgi:TonB family protein